MSEPTETPGELLTGNEHRAMAITTELTEVLARIVGNGRTRAGDMRELTDHIHAVQQAVLSQAAARRYPDQYRLLGEERS